MRKLKNKTKNSELFCASNALNPASFLEVRSSVCKCHGNILLLLYTIATELMFKIEHAHLLTKFEARNLNCVFLG